MSKEKILNIAKALASQLLTTEEAIDTAVIEAANLMEAYVSSRRALHLSTVVSGDVPENTVKAMLALNDAQRFMVAAHNELRLIQQRIGLGTASLMPSKDKFDLDSTPAAKVALADFRRAGHREHA